MSSGRLVAPMSTTPSDMAKPSSSMRSWLRVWSNSRSPPTSALRRRPTASSSSMKTIEGAFFRASSKRRRMRAAPRPANISTKAEALWA